MKRIVFWVILLLSAGFAFADDSRPSESDMFGGSAATTAAASPTPSAAMSGDAMAGKPHNLLASFEENTQIGGTLSNEADFYIQTNLNLQDNTASNPNILFLYLDSKLENDARVFARIRAFYDPTGISSGNPSSSSATISNLTNPYGFGTGTSDNFNTSLQELRISANIAHQVFFTIGRQKVKYGAAHFFNPTDFLNPQPFNFFLPTDERAGVDMIKAQVPMGITNFYAAGVFGNPTTGNTSGGYFREEIAYNDLIGDFLGSGEISFSGFLPKDEAGEAGFDLSQAVGDFDVYFEGAAGQNSAGNWQDAISTGFTWGFKYGDRDTNTLNLDGEYAQAGARSEFGALALTLGGPGGLNDITFVESNIFDFIHQVGLSRLDTVCQFTERISGRVYVSAPWGAGSALYLPDQLANVGTRLDVSF